MGSGKSFEGSASLFLVPGVAYLDAEDAVFEAMLEGWRAQRLGGRNLRKTTVKTGLGVVRRFRETSGLFPWQWTPAVFDEWMEDLVSVPRRAPSTVRNYQIMVGQFCEFICSPLYGWVAECEERFGTHPMQVCTEWNTIRHRQDYEGRPRRRPMTRAEVQRFLDYADEQVEVRLASGRKGALGVYRDASLFKVAYAWGLRAKEAALLDVTDF